MKGKILDILIVILAIIALVLIAPVIIYGGIYHDFSAIICFIAIIVLSAIRFNKYLFEPNSKVSKQHAILAIASYLAISITVVSTFIVLLTMFFHTAFGMWRDNSDTISISSANVVSIDKDTVYFSKEDDDTLNVRVVKKIEVLEDNTEIVFFSKMIYIEGYTLDGNQADMNTKVNKGNHEIEINYTTGFNGSYHHSKTNENVIVDNNLKIVYDKLSFGSECYIVNKDMVVNDAPISYIYRVVISLSSVIVVCLGVHTIIVSNKKKEEINS